MTKPTPDDGMSIEKLLQDRAQFVSWLTRLNASGENNPTVPESVRSRVRADYERRLEAVLEELRRHTSQLERQVETLSARQRDLAARESECKEQLAEAEVRHLVGEYDETKWQGIRAELNKVALQVREELTQANQEADRLNEVLGTIRAPVATEAAPRPPVGASGPRPAVVPEVAPPAAEAPTEAPAEAGRPGATELPFRQVTPKPQPKPAAAAPRKEEAPGRTLWFPSGKSAEQAGGGKLDELAFLKSVTGNENAAAGAAPAPAPPPPAPKRASGGFTRPATIEQAPSPSDPKVVDKDRASGGQKTLKCGECGTLNRPTEWYCERCGAELAAL
jgi:hypothetical protein